MVSISSLMYKWQSEGNERTRRSREREANRNDVVREYLVVGYT